MNISMCTYVQHKWGTNCSIDSKLDNATAWLGKMKIQYVFNEEFDYIDSLYDMGT